MNTLKSSFLVAVALSLVTAVSAQTPAPAAPADPQPSVRPAPNTPELVGLEVQSTTGQRLGTVIDVIPDANGEAAYAVISTGTDTATAAPYASVSAMVRGGKVVVERALLENSPQVAQSDLHDKANTKWRQQADTYWAGQSARIRSATPGNPPAPQRKDR
jgi:hypothetical protein